MQVSFIVPLFNGLAYTQDCLRTLRATLPAGLAHEIVFVDDGSTDGTRTWLATLGAPCRVVLNEKNLGFAGACNRGAAAARGEFLFFLNNDLVLPPGWFAPMFRALRRLPRAGLVGNVQRHATTGALDHAGIRFDAKAKPEHDTARPWLWRLAGFRPVPAVTGACLAVRRAVWERLGAFDPAFRNGGEDVDLAFRARAAGFRNYVVLRSVVRHHVSVSVGRKLNDERNSHLLMQRWLEATVSLAAPAWSRRYLEAHWDEPRDFHAPLARQAFFQCLFPALAPGDLVQLGVRHAIRHEFERWRLLLAGGGEATTPAFPRGPREPRAAVL
ncbi:MAG: glycosyltransferase family 2 protein [Opitutae bacterium]|nr:glycosyltransferase family 2 protein [Opitutae bacterium]